jgi:hypothetical protein
MTPYTLPLPRFCEYSGMGATSARELFRHGEIDTVVVAGRRMIIVESYHRYVERQREKPQDARRNRAGAIPAFGERPGRRSRSNQENSPNT